MMNATKIVPFSPAQETERVAWYMTLHVPIYNYLIVAHVNTRKGSDADLHPPASLSSPLVLCARL